MKNKYLNNFLWRFAERWGAQGVTFVVSLVLARLLDPEVYGTVAIISVITAFLNVFIGAGFSGALIQKKNADDLDFSTVFYFNCFLCLLLYIVLFFCAPLVAAFYSNPSLTPLVRVQGLALIISGVKSVQVTYVSKNMQFRKFFFATLGGTVGAAAVGIIMASLGYGPWALIAQHLFNNLVDTIILTFTIKWKPKRVFSFSRLRSLFPVGIRLLASSLAYNVYVDLRQLLIGKVYSTEDLAMYNRGYSFPDFLGKNINSALDSILFPAMAQNQDDVGTIRGIVSRTMKTSVFVVSPMTTGLAVCAVPLIRLLLTDKWLPCVEYLRVFCVIYLLGHMHNTNQNALKALGKVRTLLLFEVLKDIVELTVVIVTLQISVRAVAYGTVACQIVFAFACAAATSRYISYTLPEQLRDLLPNILLTLFMGACVWSVTLLRLNDIPTLLVQIPLGIIVYLCGARMMKLDSFDYVLKNLTAYMPKRKAG